MKTYETSIEIAASAEAVWHVLTEEMPKDPEPFGILRLEGALSEGARLKLWSEAAPGRAFSLKVAAFDGPRKMVWRGGMPLGLFTGTRTFALSSVAGGTLFEMREVFGGPMAALIAGSIPDLGPGFAKFARALKARAEARPGIAGAPTP